MVLLAMALISFVTEFWWIEVVFNRFPMLKEEARRKSDPEVSSSDPAPSIRRKGFMEWLRSEIRDWTEFSRLPIFASKSSMTCMFICSFQAR